MLLFIYIMAQVKKYQSGGLVSKEEQLIDIGGIKYLKSDVVNIFKNQTLRDSYSKDFVGNDEEQDKLFNQIADIYAEGLDNGKMRFDSDGKHILDPSGQYYNIDKIIEKPRTSQDYFNNQSVRVMNMFEIAKKKGYLRSWEAKVNDKTPYSFSETGILTNHYFHKPSNYKWSDLAGAWFALDPMDNNTKIRTFNNRKKVLSEAILKEADLIDNDPSYRKKYRFDGELTNPMAYKEYTKAMREYAQMIANLNGFNESLMPIATTLGTNPRLLYSQDQNDTESLFTPVTEEALRQADEQAKTEAARAEQEKQNKDQKNREALEKLQQDIATNGILRNYDPLATQNVRYFDNTTNQFYDITDDLSKITNLGQQLAQAFQIGYNREQIQKNWYSWEGFAGKYLQNLTNYFRTKSEYNIYAVTNGPLGNAGKRFFAKKHYDKRPIEVQLKKVGVDYYIYDLKGNQLAKLGEYFYDSRKTAITTIEQLNALLSAIKPTTLDKDIDTGEPFVFSTSQAFGGEPQMAAYWQQLGAIKISNYDPRRFEEILKGVSMQFLSLPTVDQYKYNWFNRKNNPRTWYGTRFALYENKDKKIVFSWIRGDNEIAFISNLTKDQFYKNYLKTQGNIKYISPGFISKVVKRRVSSVPNEPRQDIIGYKSGGKLVRYSIGGTLSDAYNNQVSNRIIRPLELPKQPAYIPEQEQHEQQEQQEPKQETKLQKQPEDFTVADGVRLGASILDLTGAFMLFPKGLNLASAAVSGASLAGYIGADLMDVMEGKQELWPTLKRDAEIAGVQAIALINPVKAGQIAPALAKIVPMVPKIAALLWTYDIISDENSRKSIMDTLNKIQHMRVSEITSQDLTNLAFIGRTLIGAKMGLKSMKNKATKGINKVKNRAAEIAEVKYQIKDQEATKMSLVRGSGKSKVNPDIDAIKQRIVDEYNKGLTEGQRAITLEDVTVFNEQNQPIKSGKVPLNFSSPDIMAETWAPGRLFERAVQYGNAETGHVTRQNTWLGQRMRNLFGDNFDVPFSDEAIMQRKQQRQIDSLAKNLFGGIDQIKRTAQDIAKLKNSETFKSASSTEQNKQMQDLLTSKGYIFEPKGMEETPLYEGALAKADEIQQVAANLNSMSDLEAAGRILGITDLNDATVWKSGQPENTQKIVTSEMLRRAYSQFREAMTSNDYLKWLSSQHADLQTLAEHLSTQQPARGEWKPSTELQDKLQGYIEQVLNRSSDTQAKQKFEAMTDPTQQKNFILAEARKLLAEGKLRGSDMELIQNAYNLVKNSNPEEMAKKPVQQQQSNGEPEPEGQQQQSNPTKNERQKTIDLEDSLMESGISAQGLETIRTVSDSEFEALLSYVKDNPELVEKMKQYRSLPSENLMNKETSDLIKSQQTEANKKLDAQQEAYRKRKEKRNTSKEFKQSLSELKKLKSEQEEVLNLEADNLSDEELAAAMERADKMEGAIQEKQTEANTKKQNLQQVKQRRRELAKQIEESDKKLTELTKKLKVAKNKYAVHKSIRQQGVTEKIEAKKQIEFLTKRIQDCQKQLNDLKEQHKRTMRVLERNPLNRKEMTKENARYEKEVQQVNHNITVLENLIDDFNTRIEEISQGIQKQNRVVYNQQGGVVGGSSSKPKDPGRSGSQEGGEVKPVTTPNPRYNTLWLDVLKLAAAQIGTVHARNKIKFRPVFEETYNLYDRVHTGNAVNQTTRQYANLLNSAPTSSDARYNTAVRLNLDVNYVKALQEAFDKDREVFYNNLTKAQQTQQDNIKRHYETYNTNLANYIAQQKYQDEINEQMTTKLWQNFENLLAKKSTDIDNLNKLKTSKYWQTYSDKIERQRNQDIYNTQMEYWNALSEDDKQNKWGNSMTRYLTSAEFTGSDAGIEYGQEIRRINSQADQNIESLIEGLYSVNPQPITYQTTYGSSIKKQGGRITMAKKGSNLNWAKIENARMVNKAINESIKEANKNMRAANRELQKTIRSAASMMKKLNTQGLK